MNGVYSKCTVCACGSEEVIVSATAADKNVIVYVMINGLCTAYKINRNSISVFLLLLHYIRKDQSILCFQ